MPALGAKAKAKAVELRNALAGAGVPSSLDPGAVNVPGAWVTVRTITPLTLSGAAQVRFDVYLIAPEGPALEAWDHLAKLLNAALDVVDPDEPIDTASRVVLPHTPTQPLPAFRLVVDELIDP